MRNVKGIDGILARCKPGVGATILIYRYVFWIIPEIAVIFSLKP
jgi:hypothetical protein